jgi:hypothetical protein
MASIWNRWKGGSPANSVTSAPQKTPREESVPRFTGVQMDRMRTIVDSLNRDILLYREAEGIGNNVRILWGFFTKKKLFGLDDEAVVAGIEELATAFHSCMGPIDDHVSYLNNEQSRLTPDHGPAVDAALTEFKRVCDEARAKMAQLRQSCSLLQRGSDGEGEQIHDCLDRIQDLKITINEMQDRAPKIWQPLYHDIRHLVGELRELLPD